MTTFIVVILATIILGSIPIVAALRGMKVPDDAGLFGDSFGMVNALVSGSAFAGVILTLIMQRHELELQRKELRETRKQ